MFGVPIEKIKKGQPEYAYRQKGKVATLALGYQGGVKAMRAMDSGHELYQQACKRLPRQGQKHPVVSHLMVVQGGMDEAVLTALRSKGDAQAALMQALKAKIDSVRNEK